MKTRKRLSHNALMAELFPMLRFAAKVREGHLVQAVRVTRVWCLGSYRSLPGFTLLTRLANPEQAPDIKKRLESLIERDYLERDAADSSMYTYLA